MYYAYALTSNARKYIYVGLTDNPARRISQHQAGHCRTTRAHRPFSVLSVEPFPNRQEARNREKYLKGGCGKEFLKKLPINNSNDWRNW
jgi:putative endonuclease